MNSQGTQGAGGYRRTPARTPVGAVLALFVATALAALLPVSTASADEPGSAADALAWVDSEIDAAGGYLPAPASTEADWGLTADAALAHISTGGATSERTSAIATSLLGALGTYTTWDAIGPEYAGVRLAGPLAKVLLVAASAGLDTTDVGGVDLGAELAGLMQTSGSQQGRFSDRNPYGPDVSNGFGQAYAMLASALEGGVPPAAIGYLLDQQCPSGGFRLVYDVDGGCTSDDDSDPDATALAIQVLLVLERTDDVEASLASAVGQLLSLQAADGSFAGAPPADVPNANSTGLAAQSLRAAGQVTAADLAASWVAGELQLGPSAAGTPAAGDEGAIAYEPALRDEALTGGIGGRDQWRRATPQGLLAFDAGLIVEGLDEPPVEPEVPSTTTTTTAEVTISTTAAPSTTTTAPPVVASGAEVDGGQGGGTQQAAVAGARSGGAQLAATGADGGLLALTGAGLLALGVVAVWLGVLARPRREAWHWRP